MYSPEEEKKLASLIHAGNDVPSIALALGRSTGSVHSKIQSMKRKDFWTEERIINLKALWLRGKTGSEIGEELGTTRQAALHKLKRLGMGQKQGYAKSTKSKSFHVSMPMIDDGVELIDIKPNQCKYIHYDQDLFCGQDIAKGSFCAEHAKLCYEPIKKKKDTDRHIAEHKARTQGWEGSIL